MTTVRHLARAKGSTGTATPPYRVDIRVGAHDLVSDELATAGGGDTGPTPFAACTAITLRMYAAHKGWELGGIDVEVRYDLDDADHAAIVRTVTVPTDLSTERLESLRSIAERTPVTIALRKGTPITTTFRTPGRVGP
jgi:putative redox protein